MTSLSARPALGLLALAVFMAATGESRATSPRDKVEQTFADARVQSANCPVALQAAFGGDVDPEAGFMVCGRTEPDFLLFRPRWEHASRYRLTPRSTWSEDSRFVTRHYRLGASRLETHYGDGWVVVVYRGDKLGRSFEPTDGPARPDEHGIYTPGLGTKLKPPKRKRGGPAVFPNRAPAGVREVSVHLRCVVRTSGILSDCQAISATAPGYGFEQAAERAVSAWRFKPAKFDGQNVPAYHSVRIIFAGW